MSLLDQIALTLVPGIGSVTARALVSGMGSAEQVFKAKRSQLMRTPGVGLKTAHAILKHDTFERAEAELVFIERQKISAIFYDDPAYPSRLRHCYDAPQLLYFKGNADLNHHRIISIVGTRNATGYGKEVTHELVDQLQKYKVLIVSGLAYGIDGMAHRACLKHQVPTVGVLGHGLDRIYPQQHRNLAEKMLQQGGWLSEFPSQTIPDRENFPKRNRIIAGMADATVVVEAGVKGGALITAELANSYDREVLAFPGNITSEFSSGCNHLIKNNKAHLVTGISDMEELLGWASQKTGTIIQTRLFPDLNIGEREIAGLLQQLGPSGVDELALRSSLGRSSLVAALLGLELQGVIHVLPGKVYALN